jgi:hypothetical protein
VTHFTYDRIVRTRLVFGFVLLFAAGQSCRSQPSDLPSERVEFFEKRIRPIFVDHCQACHGPDEAAGKLRLDSKAGWVRGGESGPTIVAGDPSASLLIRAVSHQDAKLKMPPPDAGRKLSEREIKDLVMWIRQGATDPRIGKVVLTPIDLASRDHWAFQPVKRPKVDSKQHPIDFLIDQKLKQNGFEATGPADLMTLIRRASYDLIGLPPTAEQLAMSRKQFPQLIKELLASPRYGERWGRHWLDVARYSDAKDGVLMYGDARIRPFAYTYRDYVIRAFNEDKPFDEFIREQLAADQMSLPADSPNQAAMGLLTLGRMFDNNRHDIIDDQIDVVTRAFLGLTVTCARCHDHKFDPVPTADYYSLYGVFASSAEPYERPRIQKVSQAGQAFEKEYGEKLKQVFSVRQAHYERTLETARDRTPDYLVKVATSEADISETAIFFLSLLPEQLRPQMTWRWRKLIARRAFSDDPIFGPWHDLMEDPVLRPEVWQKRKIDSRIIDHLVAANPKTPEEIARAYGQIIRSVWAEEADLKKQLAAVQAEMSTLEGGAISLSDIVAGGNGFGRGVRGNGIHPATGKQAKGGVGFIDIEHPDKLIPVPSNRFIDGVFVPRNEATVTSTGIKVAGITPTSGKTWDYFKFGPSSGFTTNSIDGTDFSVAPNGMLAMHANKGISFDVQAMRSAFEFQASRFQTLFGHGGAKDESQLDFEVFLDGKSVLKARDFRAQQEGLAVDIEIPEGVRFLTLMVTEGTQGISHDQAILGNPRIVPDSTQRQSESRQQRIAELRKREAGLRSAITNPTLREGDPLAALLYSRESPIWFPIHDIYFYLSRKDKDAFRGLVNQLDGIAVKHKSAASRAMVMVDSEVLYEPVIFQRGDPGQRGAPVPRRFLKALSKPDRKVFSNGSGRLDLANAIASPENPLTARVWVNRVWMHHFGEPLVADPSDFGLRTERPVQHELLDVLAATLIENGWRTKPLHELIMTSQAWQCGSRIPKTAQMARQLETDSTNQFLWHANRRRLDLEQMRDTLLAVSGRLDETMFGRPLLITDPKNDRRTIYSFVERQNIPDIVQTFDSASADTSTSRRVTTTVPQQALFAMNSTFVTAAAEALADHTQAGSIEERIQQLYRRVLGRPATSEDVDLSTSFVKSNSWQQLAQVLLMTNELMFVD